MSTSLALIWELLALDKASPAFRKVSGAALGTATAMDRAVARVGLAGRKMSSTGALMSHRLTLPLLAIGAASVKAATDFNSSMTRIQTQAGGSAKDVKVLTRAVLDMKGAQQGPNDLAGALYHLKSVGLDNAGAMKALRAGSDLAAVGNANLEDTVNALAGAWRTGIKGAKNFHDAAATVNAIIGAGNMTLPDLTGALGTGILPSAKTFGLTLKDVGSALALFTDEGVPADAAATRLRMTFSLLGAPTEKAAKLLDSIGISGLQLADDMRKPNGLIVAIGDLKSHLDDSKMSLSEQAQLLSHAFGGGRSSSALLSLVNNFDVLRQKQDQVTRSLGRYNQAVAAQKATPQAKFKLALASLEKAGILLGNQLLPIATQFAHVLASLASGFNDMSSGQKHFVAEVGVALLVLGPMLSIVGKLTRGIALMWAAGLASSRFVAGVRGAEISMAGMETKAYAVGLRLRGMGVAARAAGGAVAGLVSGFAIGSMVKNANKATKAVGVLGATLSGAAVGSIFGPVGAAVGALSGLLGGLAGAFGIGGDGGVSAAAKNAAENIDFLTAALVRSGGAVTAGIRAFVAQKLAYDGVLDQLGRLGISYGTATSAALGNKSAMDQVRAAGQKNIGVFDANGTAAAAAADDILNYGKQNLIAAQAQKKQTAATMAQKSLNDASRAASKRSADAVSRLAAGSLDAAGATRNLTGAQQGEKGATDALNTSVRSLTKSYLNMVRAALGLAQSEDQFLESVRSSAQAVKASNGSLSKHTAKGLAARDAFYGAADAALNMRDSEVKNGASIKEANRHLLTHITNLRNAEIAAGGDAGAIDRILGRLRLMPSRIKTLIDLNTAQASAKLFNLTGKINSLVNGYHQVTVSVVENDTRHGNTVNRAMGGIVRGRGTGTSDSIHAKLSNGEFVVRASQATKNRSLLESINKGTRGFAGGGHVGVDYRPRAAAMASQSQSRGPVRVHGKVGIDVDSQGRLYADFREIVLDELALDAQIGRM